MVLNSCLFPSRNIFKDLKKKLKRKTEKEEQNEEKSQKPVEGRQSQLETNKVSLGTKVSPLLVSPETQQMTDFKFELFKF